MEQPYFQVSFNESQVYLGHFTLKGSLYQGTAPQASSECSACGSCLVSTRTFPAFQLAQWPASQCVPPGGSRSLQADSGVRFTDTRPVDTARDVQALL